MKKKLLALFLALVMVGAVLPGCGDGSKDPGGQGNNGKTGEPVKGGEITVGIAQDLDDSLDPTRRWPQEPERSCSTSSRDW